MVFLLFYAWNQGSLSFSAGSPKIRKRAKMHNNESRKERRVLLSSLPYHSYCPRIEMDPWRTHPTGVWFLWQKTWKPHYLCSAIAQHLVLLCITSCTHVIYLSNVSMHSPIVCSYRFWQEKGDMSRQPVHKLYSFGRTIRCLLLTIHMCLHTYAASVCVWWAFSLKRCPRSNWFLLQRWDLRDQSSTCGCLPNTP